MHIGKLCACSAPAPVDGVDALMGEEDRTEGNWRLSETAVHGQVRSLGRGGICLL